MHRDQHRLSLTLLVAGVFALAAACGDSTGSLQPPRDLTPSVPVNPPPRFPDLSRPGDIYLGSDDIYTYLSDYHFGALASRYVLYEDSSFGLQFASRRFGIFEYAGRYARKGSQVTLTFGDVSSAGLWEARGTLRGDTLAVAYNTIMMLSDFVDGEYVRSTRTP